MICVMNCLILRTLTSIKQSANSFAAVGIKTDRSLAALIRMDGSLYFASGGDGCIGLNVVLGSQFLQSGISLLKSMIISDSAHQLGGFGDPPNERQRANTIIYWAAAWREWTTLRYASEKSYFAMRILSSGNFSLRATM